MAVYKPRRQLRGGGVAQMSTLLNKCYLVKMSTKGGGGQNTPNFVYVVCAPSFNSLCQKPKAKKGHLEKTFWL